MPYPDHQNPTPELKVPIDQTTKDLLTDYFQVWQMIDDTSTAQTLAERVVYPGFASRFATGLTGPECLLYIARNRRAAFENSRFQVDMDSVYQTTDGTIVVPYIFLGTYRGTFLPSEAQGKDVAMHGTVYYCVIDGKLQGLHSDRNETEMFEQLGVTRPQGETQEF